MGMVAALRFNPEMGAIVSDEGDWNLRFRRKAYLDNIHKLVDDDIADSLGIEVAYAGTGYPSLHHEVVLNTRKKIREIWDSRGEDAVKNPPFRTVEDISRIALDVLHAVIRRRIDLRLHFYYGFSTDELNQGSFIADGKSLEINQDAVLDKARKIASGEEGGRLSSAWFKCRATTFGYDNERGITGYYLDPEKFVMCYNYEGWDAFGAGKYAAGIVLAKYINRKVLKYRREGFPPAEGLMTLLDAAINALDTFQETGGNINITLIDMKEKSSAKRYQEYFDGTSTLAVEIVKAWRCRYLDRPTGEDLITKLIFKNAKPAVIEKELFKKASDPVALELALRGYKLDEIPELLTSKPASAGN